MKVSTVETILCDAGWRNYYFVKLTTENDIVGWSEYDEGFGAPGVGAIIEQIGHRLAGKDIRAHERFFQEALCLTRPAPGADVLIVRNRTQVRGELLSALHRCRAVGRLGVGPDNIDVEGCRSRGIVQTGAAQHKMGGDHPNFAIASPHERTDPSPA